MGSGIMVKKNGGTWKERPNKMLDRPRSEGVNIKTSCVSVGMPGGGGGSEAKMQFSGRSPEELWGKQKRTYVQQPVREKNDTKPLKKAG